MTRTIDASESRGRHRHVLTWCAAGLLPPALLWDVVGAPVGVAALWIGSLLVVRAVREDVRGRRLVVVNLGFVLLAVAFVELSLFALAPPESSFSDADIFTPHRDLGYAATPGVVGRAVYRYGSRQIYSVEFTIDEEGIRRGPPLAAPCPETSVLCFGGSFMFGAGLNDDATVPYRLEQELGGRRRVYNLALGGWGPHQMLASLESGRVEAIVDEPPVAAIYWAISDHVLRAAGKRAWDARGPLYQVTGEGRVERNGSFDEHPIEPLRQARPGGITRVSWIARRVLGRRSTEAREGLRAEDVERWATIVLASRQELRRRFPACEFHVLFDLQSNPASEPLRGALERAGVSYTKLSDVLPPDPDDPSRWSIHRSEWHPNAEAAGAVARFLANEVVPRSSASRR